MPINNHSAVRIITFSVFCFCFSLVPPHIVGENTLEDVKVKEKQNVTLTCEVTGKGLSFCSFCFSQLTGYSFITSTFILIH